MLRFPALAAIAAAIVFTACTKEPDQPPTVKAPCPTIIPDNCQNPSYTHHIALCIADDESMAWSDPCWNTHCQTSYEPALGILCVRCDFPLCQNDFAWLQNDWCPVPCSYDFTTDAEYNFWTAKLTFPPDECLAEHVPNCLYFAITGETCLH